MAAMTVPAGTEPWPDSYMCLNCLSRRGVGDSRRRGTVYMEKEAETPARMAVVVKPTVWRTRAELGVREAIVCIAEDLVVSVCWVIVIYTEKWLEKVRVEGCCNL